MNKKLNSKFKEFEIGISKKKIEVFSEVHHESKFPSTYDAFRALGLNIILCSRITSKN